MGRSTNNTCARQVADRWWNEWARLTIISSYILDLPEDLLHHFLTRLPPRSLLQLASTCKLLHNQAKSESIWRQCYINHFFWDGAASDSTAREQVKVLVQGCMGPGGRGWKREALSREGMLE